MAEDPHLPKTAYPLLQINVILLLGKVEVSVEINRNVSHVHKAKETGHTANQIISPVTNYFL